MTRALLLALTLTLAACGTTEEDPCTDEGATRCMADAAETCTDGAWSVTDDCAANGATCHQEADMMAGAAHCM